MMLAQSFGKLTLFRGWSCEIVESSSSYNKLGAESTNDPIIKVKVFPCSKAEIAKATAAKVFLNAAITGGSLSRFPH
jgi:hypothetical protein